MNLFCTSLILHKSSTTLYIIFVCSLYLALATVTLLGGQNCSTDEGDAHADPGDMISINCAVDNPDGFSNVLVWTIDSFGVSLSNIDGITDGDADQT